MKNSSYILMIFWFFSQLSFSQTLSYKPGAGLKLSSDKEEWSFRLLGYIQSTFTYHQAKENNAVQNSFFVRRARLDFIFDYLDKYQIFFELDGRGSRTELVLAQVDIEYFDNHNIQIGKFITPFSPENYRSSRGLSTIERYSGINTMFLLPSLDTQYGIMFYGSFNQLDYFLSVTNGNGKASENIKENNNAKDFQGRLSYAVNKNLNFGGSINFSKEETQTVSLVDHAFDSFNSVLIKGNRFGFLADAEYNADPFLLRGEIFQYYFSESLSEENQIKKFLGAYGELGWFLSGNNSHGLQLIGRFETSGFYEPINFINGPSILNSYILGTNWYQHGIFRLQVNVIYEDTNGKSLTAGRYAGKENSLLFLTMLQLKF